jgi:hypothetical protein
MANERIPDDTTRPPLDGDDLREPTRLDHQLQPDPELAEDPASGRRITIYAVGIAVVLGAIFYGLSTSSVQQAGTAPATSTAQDNTQPPAAPPGMRDVTPHANTAPGVTTGSAANRPPPPSPNPSDANQAANPFNRSEQR